MICEAESLGYATGTGLGSLESSQGLVKGKRGAILSSVHQRQWLRMAAAQDRRSRRERKEVLLQSMSSASGPQPLCNR